MGQSTPSLTTKKFLQGHREAPQKAQGRARRGEGFQRSPVPKQPLVAVLAA